MTPPAGFGEAARVRAAALVAEQQQTLAAIERLAHYRLTDIGRKALGIKEDDRG